jgi:hypothetical protein
MRPTKKQEQALMETLIASRKMYNACLEELITHYQETGTYLHIYEQDKRHGKEAHPDLPAVVVDTTLKRMHRSFTNFSLVAKRATRWDSLALRARTPGIPFSCAMQTIAWIMDASRLPNRWAGASV